MIENGVRVFVQAQRRSNTSRGGSISRESGRKFSVSKIFSSDVRDRSVGEDISRELSLPVSHTRFSILFFVTTVFVVPS